MMKKLCRYASTVLACTVLALLFSAAAGAERERAAGGPSPQQLREQLKPVYDNLKNDVTFQGLLAQLDPNSERSGALERYLEYLPISPLEIWEIDRFERRHLLETPPFLEDWHRRWVERHPQLAEQQYGKAEVDQALAELAQSREYSQATIAFRGSVVGTNRNVAATYIEPPTSYQGEIQVVVNPNNANQVVAAANSFDTITGVCNPSTQAIFFSSNGGDTWGYTCAPNHTAYSGLTCGLSQIFGSDPALFWDDQNNVFINHMQICTNGSSTFVAMVVARSTDGGATWAAHGIVRNGWAASTFEDKNFYAIDTTPSSPFYGRHYSCWDRSNNEKFARSTDGGVTFTESDIPTAPGGGFDLGCEIAVAKNGDVHVIWDTLTCGASCTNERMFHVRSTDGGATFGSATLVQDFDLVGFSNTNCPPFMDNRCINPFGAIDIDNSGGACDGTLYATFTDFEAGGSSATTDVFVRKSTDNGATWSARVKVNDDGLTNKASFHPFLQVDQSNGNPVVAWHDTRNSAATNQEVDFYLAQSVDCGATFQSNIQVSQPSSEFNNTTISFSNQNTSANVPANANQYGEYMGLSVLNGVAYVSWSDTRHFFPGSTGEAQRENLGFAKVTLVNNSIFTDGFESGDTSAWSLTVP